MHAFDRVNYLTFWIATSRNTSNWLVTKFMILQLLWFVSQQSKASFHYLQIFRTICKEIFLRDSISLRTFNLLNMSLHWIVMILTLMLPLIEDKKWRHLRLDLEVIMRKTMFWMMTLNLRRNVLNCNI